MSAVIHHGDCRDILRMCPDGIIDAVVCDPPYPCIDRDYGKWSEAEWHSMMDVIVAECRRVLKPTGSAVFFLQPNSSHLGKMRLWLWEFVVRWGRDWGLVQDVYWWNHAAVPESHSIQGRLTRPSVKMCVWLGSANCYRNQDAVLWSESASNKAKRLSARCGRVERPSGHGFDQSRATGSATKRGGVSPFNLLPIPNTNSASGAGAFGHGAGTPIELCQWWVRYICPPGGIVLDPFAGTGTTLEAALHESRNAVGIEKEARFVEACKARIASVSGVYKP